MAGNPYFLKMDKIEEGINEHRLKAIVNNIFDCMRYNSSDYPNIIYTDLNKLHIH
jgi:hypothetical protein